MAAAAANCSSSSDDDCAVREVAQVYELIKTHHHLLLSSGEPATTQTQLAHSLLGEALRALNVALSVMKMKPPTSAADSSDVDAVMSIKEEPQVMISSSTSPANSSTTAISTDAVHGGGKRATRAGKRRRITGEVKSSWVNLTAVPHDDGYQWRKYGEKKIQGTHFTRSYFRCTYRDDKGCHATKQIQQQNDINNNNNTPIFQVTYTTDHTCNASCTTSIQNNNNNNNLAALPLAVDNNPNNNRSDQHDAIFSRTMIKQEHQQQAADRMPDPFEVSPSSNKIHCCATASSSNTISDVSFCADEFGHQMEKVTTTTTVMEQEDPYLYDLDLLLLYDSFKYY